MAIRAAIFDYGMVLSGPPDPEAHASLRAITGLDYETFEKLYWADRLTYDMGQLNGLTYWPKFARDAGITLTAEQIEQLIQSDIRMWTTTNPDMLAWVERIQKAGLRTAVLSNMGADILRYLLRESAWLKSFNQLTWSCELGVIKPAPAIYLHTIDRLGIPAAETLFLDDKEENVAAANALGLRGIQFRDMTQLRTALEQLDLASALPPLP